MSKCRETSLNCYDEFKPSWKMMTGYKGCNQIIGPQNLKEVSLRRDYRNFKTNINLLSIIGRNVGNITTSTPLRHICA